jgi:hypothetical protein
MENNTMMTKDDILRSIREKNPGMDLSYLDEVDDVLRKFRESGAVARGPEFADMSRRVRISNTGSSVSVCERHLRSVL